MGLRFAKRPTRRPSPVRRGGYEEPRQPQRQEPQRPPAQPTQEERRPAGPRPEIGMFSGESIITAYTWFLYGAAVLLALLSVIGTFYWLLGKSAPVDTFDGLGLIPGDIQANGKQFAVAFGIQAFLTLTQYAARQMAHFDRRWYLGYIASLAVSVYYNFQSYWTPLTAILPPLAVAAIIIVGDVVPELITVRERKKKG